MDVNDWFENKTKEEVVKQIGELRKNIKKKHRVLKREMLDTAELWEQQLKPIAEPLKKLVEETEQQEDVPKGQKRKLIKINNEGDDASEIKRHIPNPPQGVKRKQKINLPYRPEFESDYEYDDGTVDVPIAKRHAAERDEEMRSEEEEGGNEMEVIESRAPPPSPLPSTSQAVIYETQPSGEELIKTPEGRQLAKQYIQNQFTGRLAKEYFSKLITGTKDIDNKYGVHVQGDTWMIGDKTIDVAHDDLIIDRKRYSGTRGLYELIFMNQPNEYTYDEEDLNNYASILEETNAHRINFSALGKIKANRGYKYKNIISRIISHRKKIQQQQQPTMLTYADNVQQQQEKSHFGSGIVLSNAQPNIVYYDNPNEIVDRLRVLLASQEVGNTAHTNEINAIVEELKELEPQLLNQLEQ